MNNYFTYLRRVSLVLFICFGFGNQKDNSNNDGNQQFHFNVTLPYNNFTLHPDAALGFNLSSINGYKNWSLHYIHYNPKLMNRLNLFYSNDRYNLKTYPNLNALALMFGINNNGSKTFISASAGLSYLTTLFYGIEDVREPLKSYEIFNNSIGISLDSEIIIRVFPGFGFGLKSLGHFNKQFGFWNWMAIIHYRIQ